MIRAHVIHDGRRWSVRILGETLFRSLDPVRAEQVAYSYVEKSDDGGEVVVHRVDSDPHRTPVRPREPGSR